MSNGTYVYQRRCEEFEDKERAFLDKISDKEMMSFFKKGKNLYDGKYINDKDGGYIAYVGVPMEAVAAIDLNEYGLGEYLYDADGDGTYEITAWSGGMKKTVTRDIHRESFYEGGGKQLICVDL